MFPAITASRPGLGAWVLPERRDNFWFMDVMAEDTFAHGVHWPGQGHSIRTHFDLSRPVPAPPDPWGYEGG